MSKKSGKRSETVTQAESKRQLPSMREALEYLFERFNGSPVLDVNDDNKDGRLFIGNLGFDLSRIGYRRELSLSDTIEKTFTLESGFYVKRMKTVWKLMPCIRMFRPAMGESHITSSAFKTEVALLGAKVPLSDLDGLAEQVEEMGELMIDIVKRQLIPTVGRFEWVHSFQDRADDCFGVLEPLHDYDRGIEYRIPAHDKGWKFGALKLGLSIDVSSYVWSTFSGGRAKEDCFRMRLQSSDEELVSKAIEYALTLIDARRRQEFRKIEDERKAAERGENDAS